MRLIDGFAVDVAARDPRAPEGALPHAVQRLVACLCLSGCNPRAVLAGRLWPNVSDTHAQGSLRSALWRLQEAVPGLVWVSADPRPWPTASVWTSTT
jgi:hypothetical protein